MQLRIQILMTLLLGTFAFAVTHAESPNLRTPAPVIYLADNLDENDNLGWCIDTVGRGFAESLHAHSCKPNGGDVQFAYSSETLQITSVAFADKSVTVNEAGSETDLGLFDSQAEANQHFVYDADQMTFRSQLNGLCIAVGESSRAAGPFMSRDLLLASCEDTAPVYLQWVILPDPNAPDVDDVHGDYNDDGIVDAVDLDLLSAAIRANSDDATYDFDGSGTVDSVDHNRLVILGLNTWIGDANLNGEFNSGDFVTVFTAGEYEDNLALNSGWSTGDWNGDGDFTSGDFVVAFTDGGYERGPREAVNAVPEPSGSWLYVVACLFGCLGSRRHEG